MNGRAGRTEGRCRGLRVSVVGGSIRGLAAATALRQAGADVQIFERREVLPDEGVGIALRPAGFQGLARSGVPLRTPRPWPWRYGSVRDRDARVRAWFEGMFSGEDLESLRIFDYESQAPLFRA